MTDLEKPDSPSVAVQAAGATLAALLASIFGPFALLVAPAITPGTTLMAERVAGEWRHKTRVVTDSALRSSGLGPDDLGHALTGDPDMIALTQKVLEAAAASGNGQKLRGLAELLGRAAANPGDRLDETQVLVAALADLAGPHFLVLEVLTQEPPAPQWAGWGATQVRERVSLDPEFVLPCLSALTRHGLAAHLPGTGLTSDQEQGFAITRLGRAIAAAMGSSSNRS